MSSKQSIWNYPECSFGHATDSTHSMHEQLTFIGPEKHILFFRCKGFARRRIWLEVVREGESIWTGRPSSARARRSSMTAGSAPVRRRRHRFRNQTIITGRSHTKAGVVETSRVQVVRSAGRFADVDWLAARERAFLGEAFWFVAVWDLVLCDHVHYQTKRILPLTWHWTTEHFWYHPVILTIHQHFFPADTAVVTLVGAKLLGRFEAIWAFHGGRDVRLHRKLVPLRTGVLETLHLAWIWQRQICSVSQV